MDDSLNSRTLAIVCRSCVVDNSGKPYIRCSLLSYPSLLSLLLALQLSTFLPLGSVIRLLPCPRCGRVWAPPRWRRCRVSKRVASLEARVHRESFSSSNTTPSGPIPRGSLIVSVALASNCWKVRSDPNHRRNALSATPLGLRLS